MAHPTPPGTPPVARPTDPHAAPARAPRPTGAPLAQRPQVPGLTIDGPTSRDLDDAIWVERGADGYLVQVSIADVAALVAPGSAADAQTQRKTATRYGRAGSDPMLPRALAEEALSLLAGEARPAVTITMPLAATLAPAAPSIRQTCLISRRRLTYRDADLAIRTGGDPHGPMLRAAAALATRLYQRRRERGALALHDLAAGWTTTEEGQLRPLRSDERYHSYRIVEELMILANELFARFFVEHDVPALFRNHAAKAAAPDRAGLQATIDGAVAHPEALRLDQVAERVDLVLHTASYAPVVEGHYGLNLLAYAHCTSPVRRRADLINQQQLGAFLRGEPLPYTAADLARMAGPLNAAERERKDRTRAHFREQAYAQAARATTPAQLAGLDAARFYRVLKLAGTTGTLVPALVDAIDARLEGGLLTARDVQVLLFSAQAEGPWAALKQRLLTWLATHPDQAVSVLTLAGQADPQLTAPQFAVHAVASGTAPHFRATARLRTHGAEVVSAPHEDRTKRSAAQRAAVDLLARVVGLAPPPLAAPTESAVEPLPAAPAENYKGRLLERCQAQRWPGPIYSHTQDGPSHRPVFTVVGELHGSSWVLRSAPVRGASLKDAEHWAAADLLRQVDGLLARGAAEEGRRTV